MLRGGVACGGSTITQQVVKTFLLSTDSRVKRKVKELVLAPRLEQNLHKDEILYLYLNQIYLGHLRYGVEEASRFYFGKGVKDLSLGEAATLAGVIQSPMRWSPVNHPVAAKKRQQYVLRRMREEGWITEAQFQAEIDRPIAARPTPPDPAGPWYADAVRKQLDETFGKDRVETEGLVVQVAMDPRLQRYAELALEAGLRAVDRRQGWRGPLFHLEPAQLQAALPLWRKQLETVDPGPGEVIVWDLGRVDPEVIEPGESQEKRHRQDGPGAAARGGRGLYRTGGEGRGQDGHRRPGQCPGRDPPDRRGLGPEVEPDRGHRRPAQDVVGARRGRRGPGPGDAREDPARARRPREEAAAALAGAAPLLQGALVAIDPATRGVRALVGGLDFGSQNLFNRALQARRQPGQRHEAVRLGRGHRVAPLHPRRPWSTTRPISTATPGPARSGSRATSSATPSTAPCCWATALAHSKNTVSVKLADALGVDAVVDFATRLGIASELPRNLTLALGTGEVTPLELTNAYASIAAHGFVADADPGALGAATGTARSWRTRRRWSRPRVTPASRPPAEPASADGAVRRPSPAPRVARLAPFTLPAAGTRPDVAYVLTSMMRQVIESGTATAARALGRPAAGKTGTTQDHRDAWFVGFTPDLVGGRLDRVRRPRAARPARDRRRGGAPRLALLHAGGARRPAAGGLRSGPGVEQVRIDPASGKLAGPQSPPTPPSCPSCRAPRRPRPPPRTARTRRRTSSWSRDETEGHA